ncbi:MAG: SGNH/GDSL hydrolase family protein [Planctomycetota bacterium]|nr:SGNH/GDSL hydrolase family protein [Planctomycetota bacterium]
MRYALVYHVLSGQAWFGAAFLFLLIILLDQAAFFDPRPKLKRLALALLLLLLPLAALSGTPLSIWLAAPVVIASLAYAFLGFAHASRGRRRALGVSAACLVLLAAVLEVPYHLGPAPAPSGARKAYIIGDSITAGGFGERCTYPRLLSELTGCEVQDLAHAGGTVESACQFQAPRLASDDPPALVLLEIGGNDMFQGTPPGQFADYLERLIVAARGSGPRPRRVLMLELPVVPGCWAFGRQQRQLARKHGVELIPKRVLAGVLLDERNTVDGIHLTQAGHDRLAALLARWVGRP